MTLLLENYVVPERGQVEIVFQRSFEIKVTAEEARREVNRWLIEFVSIQMGADEPALVIGDRVVWRVPAHISFPQVGYAGNVGTIDINVETGEMDATEDKAAEMKRHGQEIAKRLPPFKPISVPSEFLPKDVPPAKRLIVTDDGQLRPAE